MSFLPSPRYVICVSLYFALSMSASIELTLESSFRSLWPVYGQLWPSVNTFETPYLVLCLDCAYPSIADLLGWSNFK